MSAEETWSVSTVSKGWRSEAGLVWAVLVLSGGRRQTRPTVLPRTRTILSHTCLADPFRSSRRTGNPTSYRRELLRARGGKTGPTLRVWAVLVLSRGGRKPAGRPGPARSSPTLVDPIFKRHRRLYSAWGLIERDKIVRRRCMAYIYTETVYLHKAPSINCGGWPRGCG
jgi:hypothetical protein